MSVERDVLGTDFDLIASVKKRAWNETMHYYPYLLKQLPLFHQRVLDLGCGTGEVCRLLAPDSAHVTGVDLSQEMIQNAMDLSHHYGNIEYIQADLLDVTFESNYYDTVISVSSMHHLPMEAILESAQKWLREDGVFVVLDRYEPQTLVDYLFKTISIPIYYAMLLIKCKTLRLGTDEVEAYRNHFQHDTYLPYQDIKVIVKRMLPHAKLRRHLFNRYSIVWSKHDLI